MSADEFNRKRLDIPWQFRPPLKHDRPYRDDVKDLRPHIMEMVERYQLRMEQQRQEELAAKGASKGKGRRPGSGKPTPT